MVRLNSDGSLDSTFNNFDNVPVNTICPTSDGGFLFGGSFTHYQGQPRDCIVKVDANGFLEPNYFTGTGFDSVPFNTLGLTQTVSSITPSANDQYYVAGYFNGFNGQTVQPIIRLNGPQTVGAEQEIQKPELRLLPNPATESVQIILSDTGFNGGTLTVMDLLGRRVLYEEIKETNLVTSIRILPNGVYIAQVTDENGNCWQQGLVVQR